jgi:hypothetical protein
MMFIRTRTPPNCRPRRTSQSSASPSCRFLTGRQTPVSGSKTNGNRPDVAGNRRDVAGNRPDVAGPIWGLASDRALCALHIASLSLFMFAIGNFPPEVMTVGRITKRWCARAGRIQPALHMPVAIVICGWMDGWMGWVCVRGIDVGYQRVCVGGTVNVRATRDRRDGQCLGRATSSASRISIGHFWKPKPGWSWSTRMENV